MPHPRNDRRCEQCENCFKHVAKPTCAHAVKNCNGRHTRSLLTCAQCQEVRYCSRACQKVQWKEHKSTCLAHITLMACLKILGEKAEQTFMALKAFAEGISGYMEDPAISCLELYKGKERINSHVFLVTVRAHEETIYTTETGSQVMIYFKVLSGECKTMDEMHTFMEFGMGPRPSREATERIFAHRPGLLRLYVYDVSGFLLKPLSGYTLPTDVSNWPPNYHKKYDRNWYKNFLKSIGQDPDRPLNPQTILPSSRMLLPA